CRPLFAAKRAPRPPTLASQRQSTADGASRAAGTGLFCERHAGITDIDLRSRDELRHLARRALTESADHVACHLARAPDPLPPTTASAVDHLLDTLMAQPKCLGDLSQGAASQMHAADDRVIFSTSQLSLAFRISELGASRLSLLEQFIADGHDRNPPVVYVWWTD